MLADPEIALEADVKHISFAFESFVKNELGVRVDQDSQICKDFLAGSCPRGHACSLRHVQPSILNFVPSNVQPSHARTVCKHWLRGLCKKGDGCEYLHEYNLRKMPECCFYASFGYCSSGDECMYLHVGPDVRRGDCKAYTRGFCPLGATCPQKHVLRIICPSYLSGFCPDGISCPNAHPPFESAALDEYIKKTAVGDKEQYRMPTRDTQEEDNKMKNSNPGPGRPKRADAILCYKCGQMGHFANSCPNPSVPGHRGGVERGPGGRVLQT